MNPIILNKSEYVYMDCKIRMSKKCLSDIMYAAIITNSGLPSSYGSGIYNFTRDQNSRNFVDVKVHIHPSMIEEFEKISSIKLTKPLSLSIFL